MTIGRAGGAALAVVAMSATGCSARIAGTASPLSPSPVELLDPGAAEREIAAQFEAREGVTVDLSCNQRMVVRLGASYECEGTTADGEEIQVLITVTDNNGAYTWAED